ncbi:MAG: nucleotidyl transferase AbiEii/AbiGii toxin family protein [Deltaproteobacteria bacterium]|jgi:hypothetical protein|nr:nucleotidyl transferase AbiEii/AbiGii toxin family protein [Deltaproteobacteria bacterium]
MSKSGAKPIDWERLLSAAARLQSLLPDAVLVGGTAAALFAGHRLSHDADHTLFDLRDRYDQVLEKLESETGWKSAKNKRPVIILGNFDGIETGVRQLIRQKPLETTVIDYKGIKLTVPTQEEILRIKAFLILKRNATRDYIDFAALADHLGVNQTAMALKSFDALYPQQSGESALQQLQAQLSNSLPYDLAKTNLLSYKQLDKRWSDFTTVRKYLANMAVNIFDLVCDYHKENPPNAPKP